MQPLLLSPQQSASQLQPRRRHEWLFLSLLVSTSALFLSSPIQMVEAATVMTQQSFNSSDFCAMKVIVRCFASSKMGLPRQTCGAQSVLDLAKQGVGNRNSCMQATKITKWLQTTNIDTDALRNEVVSDCGAFLQIGRCVDPFKEHCKDVFTKFGLNMFLKQWRYICDMAGTYPRLEAHLICRREVPESANDECRKFAPVLGMDYENSTVTVNTTEAECIKFKLILGCRASVLLSSCPKQYGLLASRFITDFFNIQSESVGSVCAVDKEEDPVKLASTYEKYVTELAAISSDETDSVPLPGLSEKAKTTKSPTKDSKIGGVVPPATTKKPQITMFLLPDGKKKKSKGNDLDYDEEVDPFFSAQEDYETDSASVLFLSYYSHGLLLAICFVFQSVLRYNNR